MPIIVLINAHIITPQTLPFSLELQIALLGAAGAFLALQTLQTLKNAPKR